MTSRLGFSEALLGHAHGLGGKSLQPEHPRQEDADHEAKIHTESDDITEADDIRSAIDSIAVGEQLLQMTPRTHLIANKVLGHRDHAPAEHLIVLIRAAQGRVVKLHYREWWVW